MYYMKFITVTRFNNKTFHEFNDYCRENNVMVYNSPIRAKNSIPYKDKIIVLEMNNETNKITGLSIVINKVYDRLHRIYSDNNYNRFTFEIVNRLETTDLEENENIIIQSLEKIVFKGQGHMKRGSGLTVVTQKNLDKEQLKTKEIIQKLYSMFEKRNKNILI